MAIPNMRSIEWDVVTGKYQRHYNTYIVRVRNGTCEWQQRLYLCWQQSLRCAALYYTAA